jgi:hypothetical protein
MDRNYLAGRNGDANNAILAAIGYNFRRLIKWLRILLCLILGLFFPQSKPMPARNDDSSPTTIKLAHYRALACRDAKDILAA